MLSCKLISHPGEQRQQNCGETVPPAGAKHRNPSLGNAILTRCSARSHPRDWGVYQPRNRERVTQWNGISRGRSGCASPRTPGRSQTQKGAGAAFLWFRTAFFRGPDHGNKSIARRSVSFELRPPVCLGNFGGCSQLQECHQDGSCRRSWSLLHLVTLEFAGLEGAFLVSLGVTSSSSIPARGGLSIPSTHRDREGGKLGTTGSSVCQNRVRFTRVSAVLLAAELFSKPSLW